jgi:hypothetical protein
MQKLNGRWTSSIGGEHAFKRRDLLDSAGSAAAGTSGRGSVARRHDDWEPVGSASWIYERKPRARSRNLPGSCCYAKVPKCVQNPVEMPLTRGITTALLRGYSSSILTLSQIYLVALLCEGSQRFPRVPN